MVGDSIVICKYSEKGSGVSIHCKVSLQIAAEFQIVPYLLRGRSKITFTDFFDPHTEPVCKKICK